MKIFLSIVALLVSIGLLGQVDQDTSIVGDFKEISSEYNQEDSVPFSEVFGYSFEELLNTQTTVSSKRLEKICDAPGSITAYTSKDMESLGYYTLRDLADITSGYSSFRGIGEISFETRGQYSSGGFDNNRHLVLIDGIPFSHSKANRANAEEDLPLFFAKRVEFLKGPGSALYGISAFLGVINIVSKDLEENGTQVESKFSLGSFDFKKRMMTNVVHKTDEGVSKVSFALFAKDATRELLGNGSPSQPYNANAVYYDDQNSVFANVSHKLTTGHLNGLKFGAIYSRKVGGLGDFWMFDQNQTYEINQLTWEQIVPYVKYENELTDRLAINSYVKGNISTESAYVGRRQVITHNGNGNIASSYKNKVYDFELLSELKYNVFEKTNFTAGVNYVSRYRTGTPEGYALFFSATPGLTFVSEPYHFYRSSSYRNYAAYLQGHQLIGVLKGMSVTAGVRLDIGRVLNGTTGESTNEYHQFLPRIAVVQKITNKLNFKLLYGTAHRAPLIKEIGTNEVVKERYPAIADQINDIHSEVIKTYELGLTYNTEHLGLSLTLFNNKTENPLERVAAPGGIGSIHVNDTFVINSSGFELDVVVLPIPRVKVGSNASFAKAKQYSAGTKKENLGDVYNVPTLKINGYLSYKFGERYPFSVSLVGHFIDKYRAGGVTFWGNHNNELLHGYKVFDINTMYDLNKNISLELQVRNVLNEEIITPTFYAANNLSVPGADRSFLLTLGVNF